MWAGSFVYVKFRLSIIKTEDILTSLFLCVGNLEMMEVVRRLDDGGVCDAAVGGD